MPAAIHLDGILDADALMSAWCALTAGYALLLPTAAHRTKQPDAPGVLPILLEHLNTIPLLEQDDQFQRRFLAEAARPFRTGIDFPARATLLRRSETSHILLIAFDPLVRDEWSVDVLAGRLIELYQTPPQEPSVSAGSHPSPADAASTSGLPATASAEPVRPEYTSGAFRHRSLSRDATDGLRMLAEHWNAMLSDVLFSACQPALAQWPPTSSMRLTATMPTGVQSRTGAPSTAVDAARAVCRRLPGDRPPSAAGGFRSSVSSDPWTPPPLLWFWSDADDANLPRVPAGPEQCVRIHPRRTVTRNALTLAVSLWPGGSLAVRLIYPERRYTAAAADSLLEIFVNILETLSEQCEQELI
ncbi:hypothetical protein [Frankia sp. KB5]|uniref:hypothetical protein n=1 Tax=Frankia sp. KB5 TaxID=683318 RepID=UPI001054D59B|nr:hypothetical protein [Frankia sp. KB5]